MLGGTPFSSSEQPGWGLRLTLLRAVFTLHGFRPLVPVGRPLW